MLKSIDETPPYFGIVPVWVVNNDGKEFQGSALRDADEWIFDYGTRYIRASELGFTVVAWYDIPKYR